MIVDTSALIALLRQEPDAEQFAEALRNAARLRISAATLLECVVVYARQAGPDRIASFDALFNLFEWDIAPFDAHQLSLARAAFLRFGKGTGAGVLNFGDCFAYALAKSTGEPLLFKGDDFSRTDIRSALAA